MAAPSLTLILLLTCCFSLSTWLDPRFESISKRDDAAWLSSTLGESRRFFADYFFTRSDIYFHSGYYPSIFDRASANTGTHLAEATGTKETTLPEGKHADHEHDEHCDHDEQRGFLGKPKDRLDAFTRHFFVSTHTHLTEKSPNAAKEILPWIKLTAQLDPGKIESYTVGAYWLRSLNRTNEAEQFLREGFRRNPQSHEILLELGRVNYEKGDLDRARSLLHLAIRRWKDQEESKPAEQRNGFAARQILNYLAVVEQRLGNTDQAIKWLQVVKNFSPNPAEIDKRIAEIRGGEATAVE